MYIEWVVGPTRVDARACIYLIPRERQIPGVLDVNSLGLYASTSLTALVLLFN